MTNQSRAGQVVNGTGTVANELVIDYWEQGVIVTPAVNIVGATYEFVFRP